MKITQQQLNQIILEEIMKHLHEEGLIEDEEYKVQQNKLFERLF